MNTCDHHNNAQIMEYVESLKQAYACDPCDLSRGQAISSSLVLQMLNKEDFKDFEAKTEKKTDFSPSKLVTFPSE